MNRFWDYVEKAAALLAIAAVGSGVYFANDINRRLNDLETQAEQIATAPAIVRQGEGTPVVNPLHQACADLMRQAADAATKRDTIIALPELKKLLQELGCDKLISTAPQ